MKRFVAVKAVTEQMDGLLAALKFATVVPVGGAGQFDPAKMVGYFPIVGLIIGAMLSAVDQMAMHLWSPGTAAVVDVLFLSAVTGAFHVDGLADAADGLFAHRGRQQALRIMKDSRIGVMGLVAVVAALSVKWAGMAGISSESRGLMMVLIPAYARSGLLFGMRLLPYGRPEGGTGKPFFETLPGIGSFSSVGIPVILSTALGWSALWLNLFFAAIVWATLRFYRKQMGCITGDMLGAMVETTEALLFLFLSVNILQGTVG